MTERTTINKLEDRIRELENKYHALLKAGSDQGESIKDIKSIKEWQTTFDATNAAIWILDSDHVIVRANKMARQMFQLSDSEMMGKHCWEIVHGTNAPIRDCPILRVKKSLRRESMELHLNQKWFEVTADPILNDQGQYTKTVHIINDITDRKLAMNRLIEKEELLEHSQKIANVGSYSLQIATGKVNWSHQAYTIFGYEPGEIQPDLDLVLKHVHKDDRDHIIKANNLFQTGKTAYDEIHRIITKKGAVRTVRTKASLVCDDSGEPLRTFGSIQDITEHQKIERQLRQARKMEAMGTLTGGIAHDFNNILYMITGNAELALEDIPEHNPVYEQILEIKSAASRAAGIVKQLLKFGRKTDQDLKPVGPTALVAETLKLIRSTLPSTITINQNLTAAETVILADQVQIQQVIMNICINAYQAMADSGGTIDIHVDRTYLTDAFVRAYPGVNAGYFAMIEISDSGPGIDPAIAHRIFDPYFTTKQFGNGSGMGLAVAHGIVKNHGGVIGVKSRPGSGAVFTAYLPVTTNDSPARLKSSEEIPSGTESILFIDDEPSIVKLARHTLEILGYQVTALTDPLNALELFRSNPAQYDLIITDMTMPQMTGDRLSRQMKTIRPDIPVLLCTGHDTHLDEDKAFQLGIDGFAAKPITRRMMASSIRKILDRN